jgi:hypothetical protein
VRGEIDDDLAVDVEPLRVVVALLGDERDRAHERERAHEVRKLELAVQLAVDERPAGQRGDRAVELGARERRALASWPDHSLRAQLSQLASSSASASRSTGSVCSPRHGIGAIGPSGAAESFTGLPDHEHRLRRAVRARHLDQHVARGDVRIGGQIRREIARPGGNALGGNQPRRLELGLVARPRFDRGRTTDSRCAAQPSRVAKRGSRHQPGCPTRCASRSNWWSRKIAITK